MEHFQTPNDGSLNNGSHSVSQTPSVPVAPHAPLPEGDQSSRLVTQRPPGRNRETARTEAEKLHDKTAIAFMHVNHHMTQAQIARELGISQAQVSRSLSALKAEWQAESTSIYSAAQAESLRILDDAEQLYRQIFAHSV